MKTFKRLIFSMVLAFSTIGNASVEILVCKSAGFGSSDKVHFYNLGNFDDPKSTLGSVFANTHALIYRGKSLQMVYQTTTCPLGAKADPYLLVCSYGNGANVVLDFVNDRYTATINPGSMSHPIQLDDCQSKVLPDSDPDGSNWHNLPWLGDPGGQCDGCA